MMKFQLAPCQNPPKSMVVNRLKLAAIPLVFFVMRAGIIKINNKTAETTAAQRLDKWNSSTPMMKEPTRNPPTKMKEATEKFLFPPNGM